MLSTLNPALRRTSETGIGVSLRLCLQPILPPRDCRGTLIVIFIIAVTKIFMSQPPQRLDGIKPHGRVVAVEVFDHGGDVLRVICGGIALDGVYFKIGIITMNR